MVQHKYIRLNCTEEKSASRTQMHTVALAEAGVMCEERRSRKLSERDVGGGGELLYENLPT